MEPKLQEALYISDMITQLESVEYAISEDNLDNIWDQAAQGLPEVMEYELESNYMEMIVSLTSLMEIPNCPEDIIDSISDTKEFIFTKIEEKVDDILSFLKLRKVSIEKNIKNLEEQYLKDWKISYLEVLDNPDMVKNVVLLSLDIILDKINEKGMKSLTRDEKDFLKNHHKDDKDDKDDNTKK